MSKTRNFLNVLLRLTLLVVCYLVPIATVPTVSESVGQHFSESRWFIAVLITGLVWLSADIGYRFARLTEQSRKS